LVTSDVSKEPQDAETTRCQKGTSVGLRRRRRRAGGRAGGREGREGRIFFEY
jgi:hypothetical protein